MALDHVLAPLTINGVTLRNRVVRTAHATGYCASGPANDTLIAYHAERARGGVGLSILETASVHPSARGTMGVFDDAAISAYQKLMAVIRPLGMAVFQQLWHGGAHALPMDGGVPWAPSPIASPTIGVVPLEMTTEQIATLVAAFAAAAARCRAGGLDGIELHAGHGYLLQQFLSPLTNRRHDGYGGTPDNRLRFVREIIAAVRQAVGRNYPLGIRLSVEPSPGGLAAHDVAAIVERLDQAGEIDFFDVSLGGVLTYPKMIGTMYEPPGYELADTAKVARATKRPTIVSGRIRSLAEANAIIARGDAALVGMTRAHIADPAIVAKTTSGRSDEIRPCIACNQGCLNRLRSPERRLGCTLNLEVGLERENTIARAAAPKKIVVVGGGPAGLEAARVAALRGHRVTLFEAEAAIGGALRIAARAPNLGIVGEYLDWQAREARRLGVAIETGRRMTAGEVRALGPDAVVVATGATPRRDGFQAGSPGLGVAGIERDHVLTVHDLLGRESVAGRSAVVVDDVGGREAIAAAEWLAERGLRVSYVTWHPSLAPSLHLSSIPDAALERLRRHDFHLHVRSVLRAVQPGEATIEALASGHRFTVAADLVVLASQPEPDQDLYRELVGTAAGVHLVGDALSPRFLPAAIASAFAAARGL
jgi:2,4-dienoyl-CoA reductase-like NADH-dependent reductase (Old Yellow Enzyme family)/thioredoxin reductase